LLAASFVQLSAARECNFLILTACSDLLHHRHYWVIDALDECTMAESRGLENFLSILAKISSSIPLKVFISSRASADLERLFSKLPVLKVHISPEETTQDIRMFVETYAEDLPAADEQARQTLVETIVRKSAGCFLWTALVMRQLQDIYTSREIEEVLREVPGEMEALYLRNLQVMATTTRPKNLVQAILTWTLCATRSLTVEELKDAIRLNLETEVVRDLERSISSLCGQFVFVDKNNRVQIVHETAREFLLKATLDSEFRVDISTGNLQLGLICLTYLASDEMRYPSKRRGMASVPSELPKNENALASYACFSFSDHLVLSTSSSDQLFLALTKFLRTNILVWIERMAYEDSLDCLIRTAKHFKAYQASRAKHVAPLQDEISAWASDLPRLVTEFGRNLSKHPASIHELVPPLCPRSSGIYRQFGTANTGIQLRGLSNPDWDDRISCCFYRDRTAGCIACHDQWYAVGLSDGTIHVYWTSTCQEAVLLSHGEPVRILRFGNLSKVLVSAGLRSIKIWDVSTGLERLKFKIKSNPLAVDFDEDDKRLVAATRSNEMFEWSTDDGSIVSHYSWHHSLPSDFCHIISRVPSIVAISVAHNLMAIGYRSMPLCLWDLEARRLLGFCTKESDDGRDTSNNITSTVFNPVQVLNLVAVAYWHGDVAIFDTLSRTVQSHAQIDTQTLAVSPDGRTLAGGDYSGCIKLFDFKTLQPLYRITLSADGIVALAFRGDGLRLIDLRGTQANVWEPSALVRKWGYSEDDHREFSSEARAPVGQGPGISTVDHLGEITTMTPAYAGTLAICGNNSGSIGVHDLGSGETAFQELYRHGGGFVEILALNWNEAQQIVASVDVSSRIKVMRVSKSTSNVVVVLEELLDAQLGFARSVKQLLTSPDGTRLLVSSHTADFLWSLRTKALLASRKTERQRSWKWFTHPQNSAQVILLEGPTLRSFSWRTLATFSEVAEVRIVVGDHEFLDLENMIVSTNGNNLVLKVLREGGRGNSTPLSRKKESSLYTVNLSCLGSEQHSIFPMPLFPTEGIKNNLNVDILLGTVPVVFGGRILIFISESGWICSINLDTPAPYESFQRHFFVPFAWLSTRTTIISMVTARKDILFVRGHEIAIVRKGLETVEVVPIC
jgi:WD40 repeat protein